MEVNEKIKLLRKRCGWTQADLAERIGTVPPQITRIEKGQRIVDVVWLSRFAKAFGISEAELLGDDIQSSRDVCKVAVIGFVQAGLWQEAKEWARSDSYAIYPPFMPEYTGKHLYALEVRGDSMNLVYPAGSHIVCLPIIESEHALASGQKVVCQRINPKDGTIEATVKEFVRQKDGVFLVPHSTDPKFKPVRIDTGDVGENQIIAIVIGSFRKEEWKN